MDDGLEMIWEDTGCEFRALTARLTVSVYALLAIYFHVDSLFGLFFDPEDGGDVPPKCRLTFNGLHDVILAYCLHLL
jgi:hypothetical protein